MNHRILTLFTIAFLGCSSSEDSVVKTVSPYSLFRFDGVAVFEYGELTPSAQGIECNFKYNTFDACAEIADSSHFLFSSGTFSFNSDSTISLIPSKSTNSAEVLIANFKESGRGFKLFEDEKREIFYLNEGNVRGFLSFPVYVHYYFVLDQELDSFIYAISPKYGIMGMHIIIKEGDHYRTGSAFGLWFESHCDEIQRLHDEQIF
jgi:hypothetical protein